MGRKAIVKTKEPGMARRVYLVQMLGREQSSISENPAGRKDGSSL